MSDTLTLAWAYEVAGLPLPLAIFLVALVTVAVLAAR